MTVLKISQDTLIQLPAGSTGGAVQISYNGTTTGPVIASGDDEGRAVIVSGRLAKLTAKDGVAPLQVVGREAGGRLPARLTLRIYPEGGAVVTPITLIGLPVGSPDAPGIWDMSNIDDASGGMDVVTPAERQRLAVLMEGANMATVAAVSAAQSAGTAEAKANTAIANLNASVEGAATQAAAGTVVRVDTALADIAQTQISSEQTLRLASTLATQAAALQDATLLAERLYQVENGMLQLNGYAIGVREGRRTIRTTDAGPLALRTNADGTSTILGDPSQFRALLTAADVRLVRTA